MAVERFTKQQFEDALPTQAGDKIWSNLGMRDGEWVYAIAYGRFARIVIRSSIGPNGVAKDTGEDSIRLWAEVVNEVGNWRAIGKIDAWTTRVSGWEGRMLAKVLELQRRIGEVNQPIPICKKCKKAQGVWVIKSGKYQGTLGSKCFDCNLGLTMLSEGAKEDNAAQEGGGDALVASDDGGDDLFSEINKWLEDTAPDADALGSQLPESGGESGFGSAQTSADVKLTGDGKEGSKFGLTLKGNPNIQQQMAIKAPMDRSVRVLAGPGSGKTFTLTRRYGHLLENGVKPTGILMVTFNKTMADEMMHKILDLYPQVEGTSAANQICTIHALCYRLLRETGDTRTVPKDWQVKKIIQEASEDLWPMHKRPAWEEVLTVIGNAKYRGLAEGQDATFYSEWLGDYYGETMAKMRAILDRQMKSQKMITFNDMIYEVERLIIDRDPVVEVWRTRYDHVMVDEGQDTNGQAMRILSALAERAHMYIVGDADQLLYRFAGATPEANLYDGFDQRYSNGVTYMLETNYRSNREIIERCNELIRTNYQDAGGPYEERFRKVLQPREDAPDGKSSVTFTEYEDAEEEAIGVAKEIAARIGAGRSPGDFFIGSRTRAQLGYLEGPLMALGVPFVNITGGSFWQQKHIQDVFAYLKLAYDEGDSEAFKRVYNIASEHMKMPWGKNKGEYCPHRYLGQQFLQACDGKLENIMQAASMRNSYRPGVNDLYNFMMDIRGILEQSNMSEALQYIIDHCYFPWMKAEEGIQSDDEAEKGKMSDLGVMVDLSRKFDSIEKMAEFIDKAIQASEDAKKRNWNDYVVLSTIHRLKGLERPIVFGIGWSEGRALNGNPVGLLPHTFSLTQPPQMGVLNLVGRSNIEDERCIAFVLISRAKELCHLSSVKAYRNNEMWPSRFIAELGFVDKEDFYYHNPANDGEVYEYGDTDV